MKAIDLFAGAGGFSTGASMAGIEVVWAANHWPAAVVHFVAHGQPPLPVPKGCQRSTCQPVLVQRLQELINFFTGHIVVNEGLR